jgi:hypothetical protein
LQQANLQDKFSSNKSFKTLRACPVVRQTPSPHISPIKWQKAGNHGITEFPDNS